MKKVILYALLSVSLCDTIVSSENGTDKNVQFFKESWPFVAISAGVFALYQCHTNKRLHSYLKSLHKDKVDKAFRYMNCLQDCCATMGVKVHTEDELLKNIHAAGLHKQNAMTFVHQFNYIQSVVDDYNSWIPWNWIEMMKEASQNLSVFLQQYQPYKVYFTYHAPCLECWEKGAHYKSLVEVGVTDVQEVIKVATKSCKADGDYYLLETVSVLREDLAFVKDFLSNKRCKELYPTTYQKMYELSSVLQMSVDLISKTVTYNSQWDRLHKTD